MKQNFPFLLLFCFSIHFNLFGQGVLIQNSNTSVEELADDELEALNELQGFDYFSDNYLITISNIQDAFQGNMFNVFIPEFDCAYLSYQGVDIRYNTEADYTLYAKIIDNDLCVGYDGELMLISNQHGVTGYLIVDSLEYEINQIGNAQMVLSKVNDSYLENGQCGMSSESDSEKEFAEINSSNAQTRQDYDYGNCDVRCLVLYTQTAVDWLDGRLQHSFDKATNQTDQALRNSKITKDELSVEWLGPETISFAESKDARTDIRDLSRDAQALALKNQYYADLVLIVTKGSYGNTVGIVRGIGPDSLKPFGLVNADVATSGYYIFAHEFGHLFGAGHDTDSRPGIPHAHSWRKYGLFGKKRESLLYGTDSKPRTVLHYSNPDVYAFDGATGKHGSNDNARQIRQSACAVATFVEEPVIKEFNAYITGDHQQCLCKHSTFSIRTFGGPPGQVETEWSISDDGIKYNTVSTNNRQSFTYSLPCPSPITGLPSSSPGLLYIKARITSPTGQVVVRFHTLEFLPLNTEECGSTDHFRLSNPSNPILQIAPNPVSSNTISLFSDDFPDCPSVRVKILDTEGNLVLNENKPLIEGLNRVDVQIGELHQGLYFSYFVCPNGKTSQGTTFVKL